MLGLYLFNDLSQTNSFSSMPTAGRLCGMGACPPACSLSYLGSGRWRTSIFPPWSWRWWGTGLAGTGCPPTWLRGPEQRQPWVSRWQCPVNKPTGVQNALYLFLDYGTEFYIKHTQKRKQPECPSEETGENELWFIQTMVYYDVTQPRKNKDPLCTATASEYTLLNGTMAVTKKNNTRV